MLQLHFPDDTVKVWMDADGSGSFMWEYDLIENSFPSNGENFKVVEFLLFT